MAKSLRSQLNQIRAWVREGRTDAWIAHQLEVSASELRDFRRRHDLAADDDYESGDDLRDEIEAEVEAATFADEDEEDDEEDEEEGESSEEKSGETDSGKGDGGGKGRDDGGEGGGRRRRRRRGGRGRKKQKPLEAAFDHGEEDGYGLWLDASVKDNPTYNEHWAGHRKVEVTIEPEQIVIRRSG